MAPFLLYILLCTVSYNTVGAKGNSPPPLVAGKPLSPPPPPPQPVVVVPPKWPYHVNISTGVEGVVFCASCRKLSGFNKSNNAAPLRGLFALLLSFTGAVVKLLCFERPVEHAEKEKSVEVEAEVKTDEKGYFLIRVAKIKARSIKRCRVYVSPPNWCSKAVFPLTNKRDGIIPRFEKVVHFGAEEIYLYTAGFFEFEPITNLCPH